MEPPWYAGIGDTVKLKARAMLPEALKDVLKVLITFGFIFAAGGVAFPFTLFGLRAIALLNAEGVSFGLLLLATAAIIWAAFGAWLAWCRGRLRRFTLRSLLLATTLAAIYMGLLASVISQSSIVTFNPPTPTKPTQPSLVHEL